MVFSSMAATAEVRSVFSEATNLRVQASGHDWEFDLLAACCAGFSADDRVREILCRSLDWEKVLGLVDHHRVVPQVYSVLAALSPLVPAQALDALRWRYQDNARKALWFTTELQRLLSHLESAGIRALPYKGPVLARTLYSDVTQRQFSDLDILILPEDVLKAKAALRAFGQTCSPELRQQEELAYIASGCGYVFHGPAGGNLLDLQWRIVPRFYSIDFDMAGFLDRAQAVTLGACSLRTLQPQDLLLVLCVHAAKHVWVQLSWLCDIAQLAKSQQLPWDEIQDEAQRLGIERILSLNLLLAQRLLGASLPLHVQTALQYDPSATTLAEEIQSIIERSTYYDTEAIPYFRLMMRLRERWPDRARFLWRLVLTPSVSEWSAVRFPRALQPLYCLVRLSRLAKRLASAARGCGPGLGVFETSRPLAVPAGTSSRHSK